MLGEQLFHIGVFRRDLRHVLQERRADLLLDLSASINLGLLLLQLALLSLDILLLPLDIRLQALVAVTYGENDDGQNQAER